MVLKPIFELGVDEAYVILVDEFGIVDLPPLEAIENEDWGRDLLLTCFTEFAPERLRRVGLTLPSKIDGSSDSGSIAEADVDRANQF